MLKHRFSKLLIILLAAAMSAGLATSCGNNPAPPVSSGTPASSAASSEASAASSAPAAADGLEKGLQPYDEPVTVSMFLSIDPNAHYVDGETPEDNLWTRLIQDKLNIKLDYKWVVNNDQYDQKLSVAIASKDFADIMKFGASDKNYSLMYQAGYLQDLTNVYEEYATKYTRSLIEADGGVSLDSAKMDGKLMGIPNTNAAVEGTQVMYVRTDWLEKSGKSAPKTFDELYDLAKLFKEKNYDGANAVYGISMDKGTDTNSVGSVNGVFAGFGAYPQKWLEKEDGSIVYGSIQPEVRETLSYLAKLYKEGLIDQEYGVKDGQKVGEDACSGKIGLYFGHHASPLNPLVGVFATQPDADWTPCPIPSKDGKAPVQCVGIAASNYWVATKDCKNPEAVLKLMNLYTKTCFSDEGDPLYYITGDKYREPFIQAPIQAWPMTKNIDIAKRIKSYRETGDESILKSNKETESMFAYCKAYEDSGKKDDNWAYAKVFDVNGSELVLADYLDGGNLIYNAFYGPATETMAAKQAILNKQEAQTFTQIIMGAAPIEEFDKFVAQWKQLGGDQMTKEVNDWAASR